MKIQNHPCLEKRRRERGLVTLIFIALVAVMVVLVATNVSTILRLGTEEKAIEQKQIQRLNAQTNAPAAVESFAKAESK